MAINVDIFGADLLYHQSCHSQFIYGYEKRKEMKNEMTDKETSVFSAEK